MRLHDTVIWHEDQGTILILFANEPMRLKGSAIDIWKSLVSNSITDVSDIVNELVQRYPTEDADRITLDVKAFLSELASLGILIDEGGTIGGPSSV